MTEGQDTIPNWHLCTCFACRWPRHLLVAGTQRLGRTRTRGGRWAMDSAMGPGRAPGAEQKINGLATARLIAVIAPAKCKKNKMAATFNPAMRCQLCRRLVQCLFALLSAASCGNAWSPISGDQGSFAGTKNLRSQDVKLSIVHSAFVASVLGGTLFLPLGPAIADVTATDASAGLSAATEYQPQIKFSGNRPNQGPSARGSQALQVLPQKGGESPILLQGLVYVDRPDSRPSFADTLVITAGSAERPDEILAGAKIPVTMARFPMQFSMYQANIARGKEELWSKAMDRDIIVTARVCPEASVLPYNDAESTYKAKGISKIIRNLPGMDEGTTVRTAISLPLK